jgi:hypothetical protein
LLPNTAKHYQQELESDRELFQVIALDANGVPHSRITTHHATKLVADASQTVKTSVARESEQGRKRKSSKSAVTLTANVTHPQITAPH